MQQRDSSFRTTADFVFENHGPATVVTMGFPEKKWGDVAGPSLSLLHFATWVDGHRVKVRRQKILDTQGDFTALWVKKVRFGRNEKRRVRVSYSSYSGAGYSDGTQEVRYDFTGGNWRGKVRESVLEVRFLPGWYLFNTAQINLKNGRQFRRGAHFQFRWTNWQAQSEFSLSYYTVFPNELISLKAKVSDKQSFLGIEPGRVPLYRGIPTVTICGDSVLWKGRLWIDAQKLATCQWNEKRQGMILRLGKRACLVSARGANGWSRKWPLDPDTFLGERPRREPLFRSRPLDRAKAGWEVCTPQQQGDLSEWSEPENFGWSRWQIF